MGEIIFHVFLMGVLGIFFGQTMDINTARMTDPIGPAGFPRIIIMLAFVLLVISLRGAVRRFREKNGVEKGRMKELDPGFLALLAAIIGFVFLVNYISFWLASFILIGIVMVILGQKKVPKVVLVTLVASLVFTMVFGRVLNVPLPRGYGLFKTISHLMY